MRRLFSYKLAILFYFLQDKTLRIPYITNRIPKETLDSLFDKLERIVKSSNLSQDIFCREVQNDFYIVSVEEPQKHILKNYLQKYCIELVNDRLKTRNKQMLEWDYVRQEFIKRLVKSHYNLNCFISTNIYDMPQLAPELIKLDAGDYELEIKIDTATERISEESFSFKCSLNLSSIVEEQKKTEPQIEQIHPIRTNFNPQQQRMYNYLERSAKHGIFSIEKTELQKFVSSQAGDNALNEAVRKLNKQYREISNTEVKLIEHLTEDRYTLENVWNYRTPD